MDLCFSAGVLACVRSKPIWRAFLLSLRAGSCLFSFSVLISDKAPISEICFFCFECEVGHLWASCEATNEFGRDRLIWCSLDSGGLVKRS